MPKFQNKYRTQTTRLKGWDYTTACWYYVAICTHDHLEYFGNVIDEKMELNQLGKIADTFWKEIPVHFPNTELHYYVIMPNHVHGIIILNDYQRRDVACNVSTMMELKTDDIATKYDQKENYYSKISSKQNSLPAVIRSFKSVVTKEVHKIGNKEFAWQSRFYDRIIRSEKELFNIRNYIEYNPLKWELEKDNPENIYNF